MRRSLALCLAALPALYLTGPASAEPAGRLLTVTGSAEAKAEPDRAEISAGVVTQGPTAADALSANAARMQAVIAALEKSGLPRSALSTSGFSVSPTYVNGGGEAPRLSGYAVSNTITVELPAAGRTGPVLDTLVSAGANQIEGVRFGIADPAPLLAKARAAAMAAASEEARTYAAAAGVRLGPIQAISAGGGGPPRPVMLRAMAAKASTPILPGEQSVSASVTVTWAIQ